MFGVAEFTIVLVLILGAVAGFATGRVKGGRGVLADLLLGALGALIGLFLSAIVFHGYGIVQMLVIPVIGAVVLVALTHLRRGPRTRLV